MKRWDARTLSEHFQSGLYDEQKQTTSRCESKDLGNKPLYTAGIFRFRDVGSRGAFSARNQSSGIWYYTMIKWIPLRL